MFVCAIKFLFNNLKRIDLIGSENKVLEEVTLGQ